MAVNTTRKLFEEEEEKYVAINYIHTAILKSGKWEMGNRMEEGCTLGVVRTGSFLEKRKGAVKNMRIWHR